MDTGPADNKKSHRQSAGLRSDSFDVKSREDLQLQSIPADGQRDGALRERGAIPAHEASLIVFDLLGDFIMILKIFSLIKHWIID